jgi:glyoxylase-like metal-dependent hydrolase (beta-lactamase superfamily II)
MIHKLQPYTIVLAPNASLMTGAGTNTIVLGGGVEGATVIDPAVDDRAYLDTIIEDGADRGDIRRILITHGHHDHIGGLDALRKRLHVEVFAFSKKSVPQADYEVEDGMVFPADDDTLRAVYTPGHVNDHLCYYLERQKILFAGDVVAGTGTVVIIPPEGDMQEYFDTLKRLQAMDIDQIVPAHGPVIANPQAKLAEYIAHRLQREQQVLAALEESPRGSSVQQIVKQIYFDVDPSFHPVAAWSVEAHLIKLEREGQAERIGENGWALADPTA